MFLDFSTITSKEAYFNLCQCIVPRPVAWTLSEISDGKYNLAPFSWFNAVCSDPPLLILSVGKKSDGTHKDTRVNIENNNEFVIHIANRDLLGDLNESSATLSHDESEVSRLNLDVCEFESFRLPRLEQAPIAIACTRYDIQEIGNNRQSLIFGEVRHIYVDDRILTSLENNRFKVHTDRLDPISRLGPNEFTLFGDVVRLQKPR